MTVQAPPAPDVGLWTGKRLLWVDDRPEGNFHEAGMFSALGAKVRFVRDNAAAAAAVRGAPPAAIVSDIGREGTSETGLDLPAALRTAGLAVPPLVYYTGKADSPTTREGFPVTDRPDELFRAVETALTTG